MSKIQSAVDWAVGIANDSSHGYDQTSRWGPNYDCSSLVISAYQQAGVPVKTKGATYTGNMRSAFLSCGFADVTGKVALKSGAGLLSGDVLPHERNHTAMYIGNGRIVHASINERGGITGGKSGDQTGGEICTRSYYNYPWDCVLRLTGEAPPTVTKGTYMVQPGEGFWVIADKVLGDAGLWRELAAYNGMSESHVLHPGDVLKIPGVGQPEMPQEETPSIMCSATLPTLKPGYTGRSVLAMQTLLMLHGYELPDWGADGEWGDETTTAVEELHEDHDIEEDGCGPCTWAALIG